MSEKKELMNEAYDNVLTIGGTALVSMVCKKIAGMSLGPETLRGTAKLAGAVALFINISCKLGMRKRIST